MTERRFPRLAKLAAVGVVLVTQVTCSDDLTSPQVTAATAALLGTVTNDSETDIRTGGSTILLTLGDDTWIFGGFNAQRQAIIDGLTSAQGETDGWNARVQTTLTVGNVVRTSPTVVTVTLPAVGTYDITAAETITATIPAAALVQSASAVVAAPTFPVTVTAATAALTGRPPGHEELDQLEIQFAVDVQGTFLRHLVQAGILIEHGRAVHEGVAAPDIDRGVHVEAGRRSLAPFDRLLGCLDQADHAIGLALDQVEVGRTPRRRPRDDVGRAACFEQLHRA